MQITQGTKSMCGRIWSKKVNKFNFKFEKYFTYFMVFSATKNNSQAKNIFGLTKKLL
jgi:hypothetical protein